MIEATAKKLEELFELYPVDLGAPTELTMAMKHGLARMYADIGTRTYLENAIKNVNKDLLFKAKSQDEVIYLRAKILTLMTLLETSKNWYNDSIKLQDLKDKSKI